MTNTPTNRQAKRVSADRPAAAVTAVFDAYPKPLKSKLLALRRLILDTARTTKGVGAGTDIREVRDGFSVAPVRVGCHGWRTRSAFVAARATLSTGAECG